MEENKVLINLDKYDDLLITEHNLIVIKDYLFNNGALLSYNKSRLLFEIDSDVIQALFPYEYKEKLKQLTEAI